MQMDGMALFDMFHRMSIDGFVFNCSGPVKPVAFAQAAAKVFLHGSAGVIRLSSIDAGRGRNRS
jgi:hypothetical protein